MFATRSVCRALQSLLRESGGRIRVSALIGEFEAFEEWLAKLPMQRIFPARTVELDRGLTRSNTASGQTLEQAKDCMERMQAFFEEFHGKLEDNFFSHIPANPE